MGDGGIDGHELYRHIRCGVGDGGIDGHELYRHIRCGVGEGWGYRWP